MARNTLVDHEAVCQHASQAWKRDDPDKVMEDTTQQSFAELLAEGRRVNRQLEATLSQADDSLRNQRDDIFKRLAALMLLLKSAIVADPAHDPDSTLFEAFGGVRKSERRSGLTRKRKSTTGETFGLAASL